MFGKYTSTGKPSPVNVCAAPSITGVPITKIISIIVSSAAKMPTVFQLNNELRYRIIKIANVNPKTSIRKGAQTLKAATVNVKDAAKEYE